MFLYCNRHWFYHFLHAKTFQAFDQVALQLIFVSSVKVVSCMVQIFYPQAETVAGGLPEIIVDDTCGGYFAYPSGLE
jgi:hypothetical protein